jgi:uncharacterized protein
MGRIAFFLLLGLALYVGFRLWRAGQRRDSGRTSSPDGTGESMVRCEQCGLNVPQSEAVADAGRWYCSEAHRRLGREAR